MNTLTLPLHTKVKLAALSLGLTLSLGALLTNVAMAQAGGKVMSKEQMIDALRLDKAAPAKAAPSANTGRKMKTRGLSLDDDEPNAAAGGGPVQSELMAPAPAQAAAAPTAQAAAPVAMPAPVMPTGPLPRNEPAPQQTQQAQQAAPTQQKSIDLDIPFEFNSDRMTPTGMQILDSLGEALTSEALANVRFVVLEGHTDAIGNAKYNEALSQRRAEAARRYITFKYRINASRVNAVGKGFTELADPSRPNDAVNRRVRVVVSG